MRSLATTATFFKLQVWKPNQILSCSHLLKKIFAGLFQTKLIYRLLSRWDSNSILAGKSICLINEVRSHVILSSSLNFLRINILLKIPEGINQQKFHPDNKSWFKHWSKVFNIGMSKVFRNKSEKIYVYAPLFEKETRCLPIKHQTRHYNTAIGHSRFPALWAAAVCLF